MAVYVALIRAIGPITHAKMRMGPLRDACAAAGLENVSTIGNTGNVLFTSEESAAAARKLVQGAVAGFGLDNEVFIRTPRQMAEVIRANPIPVAAIEHPSALGVCSFHRAPDWRRLMGGHDGPEALATIGSHLIIDFPVGISGSKLRIEKQLGATMTMRNWKVFAGLSEKATALSRQ
jgi:uncharacterized protein (DUF1697 family)